MLLRVHTPSLPALFVSSSHLSLSPLFIRRGVPRPQQEDDIQPVQLHALLVSFEAAEITAAAAQALYQWPYTCQIGGRLANVACHSPEPSLLRACCALQLSACSRPAIQKSTSASALYRQDVSGEISRATSPAATKPGEK